MEEKKHVQAFVLFLFVRVGCIVYISYLFFLYIPIRGGPGDVSCLVTTTTNETTVVFVQVFVVSLLLICFFCLKYKHRKKLLKSSPASFKLMMISTD